MLDSALLCYGTYRRQFNVLIGVFIILCFYISFWREDVIVDTIEVNSMHRHTLPVPRRNILETQSDIFENLLKKNISTFSDNEFTFFLSFKENQYKERRERIEHFCDRKGKKFGKSIRKNKLIFDDKDGIAYCQIAKVASSTWCNHFIGLGRFILSFLIYFFLFLVRLIVNQKMIANY